MALLTIEKIIFLNNVSIFQSMDAGALHLVANITKEQEFSPSEIIFNEGDIGDKMFIVVEGEVELTKEVKDQPQLVVGTKKTNEFFGEMALFDDEPRSAGAKCRSKTTMLVLEKDDLIELLYDYPNLSFGIIKGISAALREANRRFIAQQK